MQPFTFPTTMTKSFEILVDDKVIYTTNNNYQRFVNISIDKSAKKIELRPIETFGAETAHIFSFDFK